MIAVDTNLLVYAHRRDAEFHSAASRSVKELAEGRAPWAIPWPCLHEFFAICTHPKIFDPPSTVDQAVTQIDAWLGSPSVVLLAETGEHWDTLRHLLTAGRVVGPLVHDARIAALCATHGVRELWSADRDFSRFAHTVAVRNPLVV
ncbi:TA system VapC family ribonuclease toxin [Mycobacterium sp. ACS4331]|uniref:TA system VapC family ribonuclease toxin n=1 Tax=Mycobacterium sp. ACS4331 TaxID=1834121 RepID=UPI000800417E|nr:TA system VapC family ribonuclease toxin [Mycobacterium sp. ACS4331]OBF15729.1 toxin PIN [Mycobacterium sp. ACS4331]